MQECLLRIKNGQEPQMCAKMPNQELHIPRNHICDAKIVNPKNYIAKSHKYVQDCKELETTYHQGN